MRESNLARRPAILSTGLLLAPTLWLTGMYLRLPILAVPPVAPLIHRSLGVNETWIGVLTMLPTLLFALVAVPGAFLIARLGLRRTLIAGMVLVGLGSGLRGAFADRWFLLAMTLVMGSGIALMQPAMPSLARAWYPRRVGFATALYTNGWLVGELVAASLTLPLMLPLAGGSWRLSFAIWAAPAAVILALLAYARPPAAAAPAGTSSLAGWRPDWRDRRIWVLGLMLGGSSALYFGTNTFLPDFLHATGRADLVSASLATLNGAQMAASMLLIMAARRVVGRRAPFLCGGLLALVSAATLIVAPGNWILAGAAGIGFATSWILVLTLALPPILAEPGETHRLSAPIFAIGYLCSFVTALAGGWLWDLTGTPYFAFLPAAAYTLALIGLSLMIRVKPTPSGRKNIAGSRL